MPNRRGELTTYRKLDPGERYVIGADVAMGVANGDYSVAQVLDSKSDKSQPGEDKSTQTTLLKFFTPWAWSTMRHW